MQIPSTYQRSVLFVIAAIFCVLGIAQEAPYSAQNITTQNLDSITKKTTYQIKGVTVAEGLTREGLKTGRWDYYTLKGHLRYQCHYSRDTLDGEYTAFYSTGELRCNAEYTSGKPSGEWKSYYKSGQLQGHIFWNGTKKWGIHQVGLFYENGQLAFKKNMDIGRPFPMLKVWSFYETGIPFETYSVVFHEKDALHEDAITHLLLDAAPHLTFSEHGKLTEFYIRNYASGKVWMHCEYDEGRLVEVFEQNTPSGEPLSGWVGKGTGKAIHFHQHSDTAAIIHYTEGVPNGHTKYFHKKNNTYKTGTYSRGTPDGEWHMYSFSSQLRQTSHISENAQKWTFYGPKSKKLQEFHLTNGLLSGPAYDFNFYGDTIAKYGYKNGFNHGSFRKYQAGELLRSGLYESGEQIGEWYTHGQFNPITHTTSFGDKSVKSNEELLPLLSFSFHPKIQTGLEDKFITRKPEDLSLDVFSLSETAFSQLLFTTPDSDDVWGTSWIKGNITASGHITHLNTVKSPSVTSENHAMEAINAFNLCVPAMKCGFPVSAVRYFSLEHWFNSD